MTALTLDRLRRDGQASTEDISREGYPRIGAQAGREFKPIYDGMRTSSARMH